MFYRMQHYRLAMLELWWKDTLEAQRKLAIWRQQVRRHLFAFASVQRCRPLKPLTAAPLPLLAPLRSVPLSTPAAPAGERARSTRIRAAAVAATPSRPPSLFHPCTTLNPRQCLRLLLPQPGSRANPSHCCRAGLAACPCLPLQVSEGCCRWRGDLTCIHSHCCVIPSAVRHAARDTLLSS
jgi:hypothetical protein